MNCFLTCCPTIYLSLYDTFQTSSQFICVIDYCRMSWEIRHESLDINDVAQYPSGTMTSMRAVTRCDDGAFPNSSTASVLSSSPSDAVWSFNVRCSESSIFGGCSYNISLSLTPLNHSVECSKYRTIGIPDPNRISRVVMTPGVLAWSVSRSPKRIIYTHQLISLATVTAS